MQFWLSSWGGELSEASKWSNLAKEYNLALKELAESLTNVQYNIIYRSNLFVCCFVAEKL